MSGGKGKSSSRPRDYDVGYCKTAVETRWKPGTSGNPSGRKRRAGSTGNVASDVLSAMVPATIDGKTKMMTLREFIMRTVANAAATGDLKAARFAFEMEAKGGYGASRVAEMPVNEEDLALIAAAVKRLAESSAS